MAAQPLYLWLLLVTIPLGALFWYAWRRSEQAIQLFGDTKLLAALLHRATPRRRWIRAILQISAFGLIIVGLARPRWGESDTKAYQSGLQVMLLLDGSTSMAAQDLSPSRIEVGKELVTNLLTELEGNQVGMLMFGATSYVQFPLTSDVVAARTLVEPINTRSLSLGGTNIAAAIDDALRAFPVGQVEGRSLIIITDGEQPASSPEEQQQRDAEAINMAREAAKSGLTIHTIGMGTPEGAPIPLTNSVGEVSYVEQDGERVISKINESLLEQVASATGGTYFYGEDVDIDKLVQTINQSAPVDLEAQLNRRTEAERFYVFIGLALLLLVADVLVGQRGVMS